MNRLITTLIAFFIISISFAASNNVSASNSTGSITNATVITVPVNGSYSNATSQQAIYAAETYLSGKLGQSYYNSYVSYRSGQSYGNTSYVYFSYSVPFSNGTTAMSVVDMQVPVERLLGITVSLKGTKVTGYIGPSKPYFVKISLAQAVNTATAQGIINGTGSIYGIFNPPQPGNNSTYSIAWAVLGASPLKSGIYHGLYIDAQSGNVIGEYEFNPLILGSESNIDGAYASPGNFSMFEMMNETQLGATSGSSDSQYIGPLIVVAIILLGIAIYLSRKEN